MENLIVNLSCTVRSGLVFYEKVDKDGDILVHNVIAHNARPTDKDADDLSLSVAQKIKALEKYCKVCRLCKLLHIVFVSLMST